MSGPNQKLLGGTKACLMGHVKKAKIILSASINEKDLDKEKTVVEDVLQHIMTNIILLERYNSNWRAIKGIKG